MKNAELINLLKDWRKQALELVGHDRLVLEMSDVINRLEAPKRITVAEASEAIGVSKASLGRWISIGRLKSVKGEYGPQMVFLEDVKHAKKNPLPR